MEIDSHNNEDLPPKRFNLFCRHTQSLLEACNNIDAYYTQVDRVASCFQDAFASNNKILVAGNGGSAAEAQHLSDELVGRYRLDRPAYPAIALTADAMVLTCIGNDYGYEQIFSRQIEALGQPGDLFIGLTTSGNSKNILLAAETARKQGLKVIAFTGQQGALKDMADLAVVCPSDKAAIVQELHLHAIHLICETLEPEGD
jgi:D-sedoheptulose 7-phosphate isomerase